MTFRLDELLRPARAAEPPFGPLIRYAAAAMALAAGLVHLWQPYAHRDEDWRFSAFFLVVGILQVLGAAYVAFPLGPLGFVRSVFAFGIAGSLATIGTWAASRTLGLPFGAEPGTPETIGLADAAADLFELFTAWLLALWLAGSLAARAASLPALGAVAALGLLGLWHATRRVGLFDPDPRVVAVPELADGVATVFLSLVALLFLALALWRRAWLPRTGAASLLVALLVVELSLALVTRPARGGQNLDCRYGPLADDSGISHTDPPPPVELQSGESRARIVVLLVACSDASVELRGVTPVNVFGDAAVITRFAVDRSVGGPPALWVTEPGRGVPVPGVRVEAGRGRYPLLVEVRARREGVLNLNAVRVDFVVGDRPGSITFASYASFCVGHDFCRHLE